MIKSNIKVIEDFEIVKLIAQNIGFNKTRNLLYKNIYNQLGKIDSQDVKNIYDAEYFDKIVSQPPSRIINGIKVNTYIDISIKYFEKINNKNIHILDFGCGAGNFVLALGSLGYKVDGIDYYEEGIALANKKAKELGINNLCAFYSDFQKIKENSFNYIVLSDVVEHISKNELKILLNNLKRYLVTGGEIIVHTPNGYTHEWGPNRRRIFDLYFFIKNTWMYFKSKDLKLEKIKQAYYDQVHINIMTPKELKIIMMESGFNDFEIKYVDIFFQLLLRFKISGSFWLKCKKID